MGSPSWLWPYSPLLSFPYEFFLESSLLSSISISLLHSRLRIYYTYEIPKPQLLLLKNDPSEAIVPSLLNNQLNNTKLQFYSSATLRNSVSPSHTCPSQNQYPPKTRIQPLPNGQNSIPPPSFSSSPHQKPFIHLSINPRPNPNSNLKHDTNPPPPPQKE